MGTLWELLLKIMLMMLFGFWVKKRGLLPDVVEKGLSGLLISAILPLAILASGDVTLSAELAVGLRLSAAATVGYYAVSIVLLLCISRFLPLASAQKTIFVITTVYANTAFLGFPIMYALYGAEGMLYAVIFNIGYQLTFFTWGVAKITGSGAEGWKALLRTPVTIASFITTLLVLTPLALPTVLQDACTAIGNMTTPLSLLLIGSSFVRMHPMELLRDKWSYLVSGLRLLVLPLLMFLAVRALQFPTVPGSVCVLMSGLPCASLGVIYAEQYDCAPDFAARAVVQTTLLMVITVPLWILLVQGGL